jgi:hypothetical protein
METPSSPSATEYVTDKRLRFPWSKKAITLKSSKLFNKPKQNEEWHQNIDVTAGILHPSDSKFPYSFLRNHTDIYLGKKSKIKQADADARLTILIGAHDARDIAIAAAAHAMSAMSLRALLHADSNVVKGSYFGLKSWLQCLIAAHDGNPASVTDLEAQWARSLLPFAIQGPRAAEWFLVGACSVLRESSIPDMDSVPEFSVLMKRAIADYSAQLDAYSRKCQWAAAHDAVLWMMELAKTSPLATTLGRVVPENILDYHMPSWRAWTCWRPSAKRIKLLASSISERLAVVSQITSLEGPDMITGREATLREGLIAQYGGTNTPMRWRGSEIEVPCGTKEELRYILERLAKALDLAITGRQSMFDLFLTCPIAKAGLDVFEAACHVKYVRQRDIFEAVRVINNNSGQLERRHLPALSNLFQAFDDENAGMLRHNFLQVWLWADITACMERCQKSIRARIAEQSAWTERALEYHAFCSLVEATERRWPLPHLKIQLPSCWPSPEQMGTIVEIYEAAKAQRLESIVSSPCDGDNTDRTLPASPRRDRVPVPSSLDADHKAKSYALEDDIEAYCIERVFGGTILSNISQRTMTAIFGIWKSTSNPAFDAKRRELALLIADDLGTDSYMRCCCLSDIATGKHMQHPESSVDSLILVLRQSKDHRSRAIVTFTKLLASREAWSHWWNYLLYKWIDGQNKGLFSGPTIVEYSLQTMSVAKWLSFIADIQNVLPRCPGLLRPDSTMWPACPILRLSHRDWATKLAKFGHTLTRVELAHGKYREPIEYMLTGVHDNVLGILECLRQAEGLPTEQLMHKIVGKLSIEAKNHFAVWECVRFVAEATPETLERCCRLWAASEGYLAIPGIPKAAAKIVSAKKSIKGKAASIKGKAATSSQPAGMDQSLAISCLRTPNMGEKRNVPFAVVEVMFAGWLRDVTMSEDDIDVVISVACLLGIGMEPDNVSVWNSKLNEAMVFWQGIEDEIILEAVRLESLQYALKKRDPTGTRLLLEELGLPSSSQLDDEMADLPAEVMNVVERVGEEQVEISFPLTGFAEMQRNALGIPHGASSLLLRLKTKGEDESPPSFCVHFNDDDDLETLEHSPWRCSSDTRPPHENFCTTPQTTFVWQLNRIIHTRLKTRNIGIADLHQLLTKRMLKLGHECISCTTLHQAAQAQLRRATPCKTLVPATARSPRPRAPHRPLRRRRNVDIHLGRSPLQPP